MLKKIKNKKFFISCLIDAIFVILILGLVLGFTTKLTSTNKNLTSQNKEIESLISSRDDLLADYEALEGELESTKAELDKKQSISFATVEYKVVSGEEARSYSVYHATGPAESFILIDIEPFINAPVYLYEKEYSMAYSLQLYNPSDEAHAIYDNGEVITNLSLWNSSLNCNEFVILVDPYTDFTTLSETEIKDMVNNLVFVYFTL